MSEPTIPWYRTPIDPATLRSLTRRSDVRGLAQGLGHLLVVGATAAFSWWSAGRLAWPVVLVALFVHGTALAFLGSAGAFHELCHGTPFRTRWLNEVFLAVCSFLSWSNPAHFRASHGRHHLFTVHHDLDGEVVLPRPFRPSDVLLGFVLNPVNVYQLLRSHVRLSLGILEGEWERQLFTGKGAHLRPGVVTWARVILLGHFVLASLVGVLGQWILIPVLVVPLSGTWLATLCAVPQHLGMKPDVPDWRLSTRTILVNPVVRFVYWQMNYHVEHHMYAAVPFHALGRLHRMLAADTPRPCRGLRSAWREMAAWSKLQRSDPAHAVDPWARAG